MAKGRRREVAGRAGHERRAIRHRRAKLLAARQTTRIVASALLDAAGMLAGVAYLVEGQAFILGAVAAVMLLMLWQFPARDGTRAWLARHLGLVAELRKLGGPPGVA